MISTEIRLNNHNSYNITSALFSYPFSVAGYEYITHSFQTFATSPLISEIRAKTKFFNDSGVLISEINHTFPVYGVFDKVEIPVEVPTGAFRAQLVFLKGTTSWWIVEPKSEEGQIATPFNTNIQSQLTFITQAGIYTGMVNAQQIVVSGTIEKPDETLETRLVTINNNAITLSSRVGTVEPKVTKITSAGVYTGEVVASQITSGILKSANNYSQINLNDGTFSFGNGALTWSGSSLVGKGSFESSSGTRTAKMDGGSFRLTDGTTDFGYLSIQSGYADGPQLNAAAAGKSIRFGKVVGQTIHRAYKIDYETEDSTVAKHWFFADLFSVVVGGKNRIYVSDAYTQLDSPSGGNMAIGVDNDGAYHVKNGIKTYF